MAREAKGSRGAAEAREAALAALRRDLQVYLAKPTSGDPRSEEDVSDDEDCGGIGATGSPVPEDVGERHVVVVVVAVSDEEARRFVVSLRCLSHPRFLRLLARAEEELGFHQRGALAIPCRSSELERVLGDL